jgi:hypothetical protein
MFRVIVHADLLTSERLVHAVAEELAQVADVDGGWHRNSVVVTHGRDPTIGSDVLAAAPIAC